MLSSWRELGSFVFGKRAGGHKQTKRRAAQERSTLRAATTPVLENLENRTMLAVLPAPIITDHLSISGGGNNQNMSQPSVAYDPTNPLDMVTVYTRYQPSVNGRQKSFINGAYSRDGGVTWNNLAIPGNGVNAAITPGPGVSRTLERATDPTVGFDRLGNFYVSYSEHEADYSAGMIVLTKYDFNGNTPQRDANISNVSLYHWVGADAAYSPTMVVNSNLPLFIDPDTGQQQIDPTVDAATGQGPVYVAWSTNETAPPNFNGFNPNSIEVVASSDGGATFSATRYVNDPQFAGDGRNILPRLTLSQGTVVDPGGVPRVVGGQLGIVWDDFGSFANANPPADALWFDRIQDGGGAYEFDGTTGNVPDAVKADPDVPTDTLYTTTVTFPQNTSITDLNVVVTLRHPNLAQLSIDLISPTGVVVPLVLNGLDGANQAINPVQGLTGANLTNTTFDQEAAQLITAGTAAYTGSFRPETGNLAQFYPRNGAGLTTLAGDWTLRVTDHVAETADPGGAVAVTAWSLRFTRTVGAALVFNGSTGRIGDGQDIVVGTNGFTTDVTIPAGTTITDLDVKLSLRHPDLKQVLVELVDPNGVVIPLFLNSLDQYGTVFNPAQGLTGADLGWLNGVGVGMQFDQDTPRFITDGAAPYLVSFKPEFVSPATPLLSDYYQLTGADVSGTWTLRVTDFAVGPAPTAQAPSAVVSWSLVFSTGLTTDTDTLVTTTTVRGNFNGVNGGAFPLAPAVSPNQGISASPVIASDNTLGSFSPFQGRLYVAYVGKGSNTNDDTDIFLMTSDDGGLTWLPNTLAVNDDGGPTDGFSEGNRPQFEPSIAVDQITGTLALTWYDGRYDASRARVANFMGFSIDGGATFAPETYANQPNSAVDAITRNPVNIEPIPDNQSAGNPNAEAVFGFGSRQGLVIVGGQVTPVWSGNLNGGTNGARRLQILSTNMRVAAGPRVVGSTMGPVSLAGDIVNPPDITGSTQLSGFEIQFDRPIDPASFTVDDVTLLYRDLLGSAPESIAIGAVTPLDLNLFGPGLAEGATLFMVTLETPEKRVGTYSYFLSENINDRIRNPLIPLVSGNSGVFASQGVSNNLDIPPVGTGGSGDPAQDITSSTITVAGMTDTINDVNVRVDIQHTFDADLRLTLVAPDGTRIILSDLNGDDIDFQGTIFDDQAADAIADGFSPFTGRFIPDESLNDALVGADPNGDWTLEVEDTQSGEVGVLLGWTLFIKTGVAASAPVTTVYPADPGELGGTFDGTAPLVSTISISGVPVTDQISDVNVKLSINHTFDEDVVITLIAPNGDRILLSAQNGSSDQNYTDTIFDDQSAVDIFNGSAPFTGSFRPEESLSILNGRDVNGDWRLELDDVFPFADDGVLIDWQLIIRTGGAGFTQLNGNQVDQNANGFAGEAAVAGQTVGDVYAVPTPTQNTSFNGTGFSAPFQRDTLPLIVPGPHVISTVLPGSFQKFQPDVDQLGLAIPPVGTGGSGVFADDTTLSKITINAPGKVVQHLTLNLTLTHTFNGDLTISLLAPDGRIIVLADGVSGEDFTNTTFDDTAAFPVLFGNAPYTGSFQTQDPNGLDSLSGIDLSGDWTLQIEDTAEDDIGTLIDWSLTNASVGGANVALHTTVSNLDVTFDRDMDPATFTPASILRMMGTLGEITGPFTITPDPNADAPDPLHPRTFRIGFPTQQFSGTYTFQLSPTILSAAGDALDSNLNAGLYLLDPSRAPTSATIPITFSTSTPAPIGDTRTPGKVTSSTITITDDFVIAGVRPKLNITYLNDPDLDAVLVAPFDDPNTGLPLEIRLFSGVGSAGTKRNFQQTEFDDLATTPIQNGGAPFFGRFNAQDPLSTLLGHSTAGTWTLRITDNVSGRTGTLTNWSLTFDKPVPQTGLGETTADQATASFRIFTMDPANPLSHQVWTPVGGASNNAQGNSSRIGGLAVDPSDPSGNTVYVGGASGGIWKTTNFMSAGLEGPTYIPLTDFGPTFGINIGGIAVFGRSSDTNKSIVFGATGEGDTANNLQRSAGGSSGVGIIRSMDGGATWMLLDSTVNVDATGKPLPINSPLRDHVFIGTAGFDIVVDPRPTPTGDVIVYAAMTGGNGGIWRSLDTGNHWQLMRAGDATDIALDYNSGAFDTFSNPTGNVQLIYAGFRGEGVFLSPNRGQVWNQMLGTAGNPLIQDNTGTPTTRPVTAPARNPNGAKGRIVLAAPALTGDPVRDIQYEGWLYAGVVGTNDHMDGLYVTKDFGQNWTLIRLPTIPNAAGRPITGIPTNDATRPDYDIGGGGDFAQGNYDVALAIDPTNPNIVYLGGTADGQATGLIRIDATGLSDPHALYLSNSRNDGGVQMYNSGDSVSVNHGRPDLGATNFFPNPMVDVCGNDPLSFLAYCGPYINLIRDPENPFVANATIGVVNVAGWTNSGIGATFIPFDIEGTDHHRWVTMVDPITGLPRLIVGDDQGLFTAVDQNGVFNTGIGLNGYGVTDFSRNGNLQINQFYYGATQPSGIAAQVAGALFYGQAQDNGSLASDPNLLVNGNITWVGPEGDGAGVATDQTGSGTLYTYNWPCCGGNGTDFFQVNGVGRTFGLLQDSQPGNTPDPQWPFLGGSTFAVNPINKDQIIISSIVSGRVFGTTNQGRFWSEIGAPSALDGTYAPAVAYGAPDPAGPGGIDTTNFFLYAGTVGGHIFVTYNGGGANGNNWRDISAGLDGSSVHVIATDPLRGTHDAYAVTTRGVYFMADSTAAAPTWVNITGNLFNIVTNAFGDPTMPGTMMKALTSIVGDWRYTILDSNAANSGSHPILYVGGEGGVYRSLDKGTTWSLFPDPTADGAPVAGGFLPNAHVSDLDIALGNIDPTTGMPDVASGPDILVATTYGRGAFAIRLAPLVVPGTVRMDPLDDTGLSNTDRITQVSTPRIFGNSAMTAFGNTVRITLMDLTDPNNPHVIGGYDGTPTTDIAANWTDVLGRFSLRVDPGAFTSDGVKRIGVHASDESGTVSNDTIITFTLDTTTPVGVSQTIAPVEGASFAGVVAIYPNEPAIGSASINWGDGTANTVGTIVANPGGGFAVRGTHTYNTPGAWGIIVSATDAAGNAGVTNSTANVSNPAVVATGGFTVNAKQNTASAVQTVATFTDPGGPEATTDYLATINWGDGSPTTTGTITLNSNTFTVASSHTYAASASFTITVTISHSTNSVAAPNAVVTSSAVVALPDLVGTGGFVISGSEGTASGNVVVATFTDPGPAQLIGAYSAMISWGDGTASAGTITLLAGTYTVTANHTYSIPGNFTISTEVTRTTSTITVQSSANIANPAVVATGGFAFAGAKGITSPVQTLATFTDPGGPELVGAYVATINWGDGGPTSIGTITNNSGVYSVTDSHKYANTGSFTITVTISHTQNGVNAANAVVTSPATILLPPVSMTGGFTFIAAEGTTSSSQTVAKFTDPSGAGAVGSYTAVINWGDGTTSFGVVTVAAASGEFTVKQSHQYAEEGSYTIHTTIQRAGSLDASTNSSATVSDLPVEPTGGFIVNASRGVQSSSQTVATFTDPAGAEGLGEYSATINWGDGRTSPGVITFNPIGAVFTVKGDHLYNAEGLFTISVTLQHGTAQNRSAISSANVVHPPLVVTGGLTYAAIEGKSVTLPVATFTDPVQGSEAISTFSASVDWGDGTSDVTGVTGRVFISVDTATGIFTVQGTHTYGEEGSKTITVTIHHTTAPVATTTSTAVISDQPVVVTGGLTVNGTEAVTFTNKTVATFTDPAGAEALTDYSGMINWGDGNSSAGVITFNATTKVFSVAGDHRYNDGGTYTITTTISHDTALDSSATSSAHIIDAPVIPTGGFTFTAVEGALSSVQTVATFKDVGTPKATSAYLVEIEWGDQSAPTAGTLTFNAGTGVFTVSGQHLYTNKGTFTIQVTISHGTAIEKTVSSTANVANAAVTVTPSGSLPSTNEGASFTGNLATFVDANPASVASMFTVTIDWGDGSTSPGTITVDPNNSQRYTVGGTHTWADGTSTKTINIKVRDAAAGEDMAPKTTSIQVLNVKPSVTITAPTSTVFRGFNANFALAGFDAATDLAAGFTYTINWGDGTAVQTITRAAGNANRNVGHTFTNPAATMHVTVRATDKDGAISDVANLTVLPEDAPTLDSSKINNGTKMRSRITDIEFSLSADAALALSDLKLMRAGVAVSLATAGFSYDAGTATAHLDMRHVKLDNANYSLLIDTGAGTLHVDFYKLAGDTDGNRKVNGKDLKQIRRSLNKSVGQAGYRANADVNANGKVDKKDLKVVKKNQQKRLPRP